MTFQSSEKLGKSPSSWNPSSMYQIFAILMTGFLEHLLENQFMMAEELNMFIFL